MKTFTFKKSAVNNSNAPIIKEGVHTAVIAQVANIGLQRAFQQGAEPEPNLAVAFELESGELIAKRMKFSEHPSSGCYALFTSAFPDLEEFDDQEMSLPGLLGNSVLVEVEVREGKWPRIMAIMQLEEGFEPVTPKSDLLEFDANEMDREVYLKLHRDIRNWLSKRVRHS